APPVVQGRRQNVMTGLLETKALRTEVQSSLGQEELRRSSQWLEDWIGSGRGRPEELGMPDGRLLTRRAGNLLDWSTQITPLLANAALGIDQHSDSSSEE
ncbi:unnamed protein product, partial [Effrenium voratum]